MSDMRNFIVEINHHKTGEAGVEKSFSLYSVYNACQDDALVNLAGLINLLNHLTSINVYARNTLHVSSGENITTLQDDDTSEEGPQINMPVISMALVLMWTRTNGLYCSAK